MKIKNILLHTIADNSPLNFKELYDATAPITGQNTNSFNSALVHLKKQDLINKNAVARYELTDDGEDWIAANPSKPPELETAQKIMATQKKDTFNGLTATIETFKKRSPEQTKHDKQAILNFIKTNQPISYADLLVGIEHTTTLDSKKLSRLLNIMKKDVKIIQNDDKSYVIPQLTKEAPEAPEQKIASTTSLNSPSSEDINELDPLGKKAHETGSKLDAGKTRLSLVFNGFSSALQAVGEVGTFGAQKYTENGWLDVPDGINRYTDALYRHLLKEGQGEPIDQETELLHAAHAAWNALARLNLMIDTQK